MGLHERSQNLSNEQEKRKNHENGIHGQIHVNPRHKELKLLLLYLRFT
jgi:hypothetical protein